MTVTCAKLVGGPLGVTTEALRHDYQASLRLAARGNEEIDGLCYQLKLEK